jgi:hypothetical protein
MAQEPAIEMDWEERARRAEAALEEALTERNRLWEELNRRAAQERELQHYRSITEHMETSASWRITRPLRALKRLTLQGRQAAEKIRAKRSR